MELIAFYPFLPSTKLIVNTISIIMSLPVLAKKKNYLSRYTVSITPDLTI